MKRFGLIVAGVVLVIGLTLGLAGFLPERDKIYDFVILYSASLGVIHCVPIYDNAAITSLMIAKLSLSADFTMFPYPYPPWYPLSAFYLAFLSPGKAANAWMLLNIAMLVVSAFLLTERWKPIPRILAVLGALLFIPSIGLLVVGQYSAPVLLGAALLIYAVRREDAPLTALGLLLMTFKPHLGLFLLLGGFFWLVFQFKGGSQTRPSFARRAVWMALGGGLLLAALGFLADPLWPLTYIRSLTSYTSLSGVASRDLSASFSAILVKLALGTPLIPHGETQGGLGQVGMVWATWLSVALIVIMLLLFWRFRLFANLETWVAACVLLTLLGDPYLFNYDYILILLPLVCLAGQAKSLTQRLILCAVYFLPWLSLLLERNANLFYAISAIFLVGVLLQKNRENTGDSHLKLV